MIYTYTDYVWEDKDEFSTHSVELSDSSFTHQILFNDYVEHKGKILCHHRSPDNKWTCTREEEHEGPHVGHTRDVVKGVWPNSDSRIITFEPYGDVVYDTPELESHTHDPWGWTEGEEDEEDG